LQTTKPNSADYPCDALKESPRQNLVLLPPCSSTGRDSSLLNRPMLLRGTSSPVPFIPTHTEGTPSGVGAHQHQPGAIGMAPFYSDLALMITAPIYTIKANC
jgi:hypothetical protein